MSAFSYDNRLFRSVSNTPGGDVDAETVFHYRQKGRYVWGTFEGGNVEIGTLLGTVDDEGRIEFSYQQITKEGTRRAGRCISIPEPLSAGRLRLHERWTWTEGGEGGGDSIVEEF